MKIKLKNPNFGVKKSELSQASYADKEILESPFWVINQPIKIPPEAYIYSLDPVEYEKTVKEKFAKDNGMLALLKVQDGKQALVQIHRWMPSVPLGSGGKGEPVGAWVIGEMQASPGEYIGRKQLVQLPIWSAEKGYYVLKELSEGIKLKGTINPKDVPRGWLVDLSTDSVLVDFEGGRFNGQIGDKRVQDESAEELLILGSDGSMYIRNSEWEKEAPSNERPRELRANAWKNWIDDAERMTTGANPNGFDRGRPGGGDGPGGKGGGS